MIPFRLRILAQTLPFLLLTPGLALAQHAPTRGEAIAALNQPAKPGGQQHTRQQIDQLVAPTTVSRTTTATANLPAGTVASARAAAVSVFPQRGAVDAEREGHGMPGQEEHPSARGPERNGAAGMPEQRENPARTPEHAGSSAPPPAHHPAARPPAGHGPEHVGPQPPAGVPSQPNKPQRAGPEAGEGSSMPPAAAPPHAQPSEQKPPQPGEHAGRPEQKEQNEKKEP